MDQKVEFLSSYTFFRGLNSTKLNKLLRQLKIQTFILNQQLWTEGSSARRIFLVLEGEFEVTKIFFRSQCKFQDNGYQLHYLRYSSKKVNARVTKVLNH